jgi:hypothetical protein
MNPIDVTVPLDSNLPDQPGNTARSLEPINAAPPRVVPRKN